MKSKLFKYGLWTFWTIFIAGLIYLFLELKRFEKETEDLCTARGFGNTSLKFKVLDLNSLKPIDSIRLTIRYGASADKFVDTLMKQEENIVYNFLVPETDDCEAYWLELSNDLYWGDIYFSDTIRYLGIEKGVTNEKTLYLEPATKVKVTVTNELREFNGDTVYLYFDRKDKKDFNAWDYFTKKDFENRKKTSEYFNLESGVDYRATWINKNNELTDTTYNDFYTKPFDTLRLSFALKEKVK